MGYSHRDITADQEFVREWQTSPTIIFKLHKNLIGCDLYVDLRRWSTTNVTGEIYPTTKGVWFPVKICKELAEELMKVYNSTQNDTKEP